MCIGSALHLNGFCGCHALRRRRPDAGSKVGAGGDQVAIGKERHVPHAGRVLQRLQTQHCIFSRHDSLTTDDKGICCELKQDCIVTNIRTVNGHRTCRQEPSARHRRAVLSSLADAISPPDVAAALHRNNATMSAKCVHALWPGGKCLGQGDLPVHQGCVAGEGANGFARHRPKLQRAIM